jgi:serine/threonine-protein kinase
MVRGPGRRSRFNREASNASRIDDENVARVYDFGEATGGTVYLAMEYVAGRSLRDIIVKDGALEPRRAADLVEQIGRGLDAAHRLKIIHRDLKPDNILVVEGPDGREKVKVVDFGIAKAFGAGEGGLTKTGFVVGTPEFMSPEQLLGGALDARSDVYALALVAYQCLTATLPFGGDTPEQSMTARLTSAPKPLAAASGTEWPPAVQATLDAALSRDVSKRPETAGAFASSSRGRSRSGTHAGQGGTAPRTTAPTATVGKATRTRGAAEPLAGDRGDNSHRGRGRRRRVSILGNPLPSAARTDSGGRPRHRTAASGVGAGPVRPRRHRPRPRSRQRTARTAATIGAATPDSHDLRHPRRAGSSQTDPGIIAAPHQDPAYAQLGTSPIA